MDKLATMVALRRLPKRAVSQQADLNVLDGGRDLT